MGTDLYGARNLVIKVDDSKETKTYDSEGNEVTDDTTVEGETTTKDIPVNDESVLTAENYKKTKEIIEKRLELVKVGYYEIKSDEQNGQIAINLAENANTDTITQYCVTKGEFVIKDAETNEVLLSNSDIKKASVQYNTTSSGTTVYLAIQFKKDKVDRLKEISQTYVKSQDAEGNDTTKNVTLALDDQTIISTYFDEDITDGLIQLTMGTTSDTTQIQTYLQQASNIAVFLNTESLPITYTVDINRFVYSDITSANMQIAVIILGVIFALMLIYIMVKYKLRGFIAAVADIGFLAILLLALRLANVNITLTGIAAIAVATLLNYMFLVIMLRENSKDVEKEVKEKNIKDVLRKEFEMILLSLVISVTFAFSRWEMVYSVGMILFWGIIIMILYNVIAFKVIFIED